MKPLHALFFVAPRLVCCAAVCLGFERGLLKYVLPSSFEHCLLEPVSPPRVLSPASSRWSRLFGVERGLPSSFSSSSFVVASSRRRPQARWSSMIRVVGCGGPLAGSRSAIPALLFFLSVGLIVVSLLLQLLFRLPLLCVSPSAVVSGSRPAAEIRWPPLARPPPEPDSSALLLRRHGWLLHGRWGWLSCLPPQSLASLSPTIAGCRRWLLLRRQGRLLCGYWGWLSASVGCWHWLLLRRRGWLLRRRSGWLLCLLLCSLASLSPASASPAVSKMTPSDDLRSSPSGGSSVGPGGSAGDGSALFRPAEPFAAGTRAFDADESLDAAMRQYSHVTTRDVKPLLAALKDDDGADGGSTVAGDGWSGLKDGGLDDGGDDLRPSPDDDRMLRLIGAAVASAVSAVSGKSPPARPSKAQEVTVSVNGLDLRDAPRSADEMGEAQVVVSRYSRGATMEAKKKLRERSTAALATKFEEMDVGRLLNHCQPGEDLGKMLLSQQTCFDKFASWCARSDVGYLFLMPDTPSFGNKLVVASAPRINLLTHFKDPRVTREKVLSWQAFINSWLSEVDVESSGWAFDKLEASTSPLLLTKLKQSFDILPLVQQGGVTLWYLLTDALAANSFENKRLLQNYLQGFRLGDVPGEDVETASACFKAAAKMLPSADLPSDLLELYLRGMSKCSNSEFKNSCSAQLGFLESPVFDLWSSSNAGLTPVLQLESFATRLVTKYRSLRQAAKWSEVPASAFPARPATRLSHSRSPFARSSPSSATLPRAPTSTQADASAGKAIPPNKSWQHWFDSQECEICHKRHPTRYHDDPGIRNRSWVPRSRGGSSGRPAPKFKQGGRQKFLRSVHQALLENADDFDGDELLAHIAGEDDDVSTAGDGDSAIGSSTLDRVSDVSEGGNAGDDTAQALAAIGLEHLTNFW